ncbi:hypothetical protein BJB45_17295 [Halomonas huangheensis]|uniref:Uncharacterized protein n=1 Tax=Halomonas huangheensis TaxID=1178482 RepID=W1ND66_9GAMM|nr:hypothetical protein AR456_09410 [Halomonas huangheensis]ERL53030.1 hypothetical protein BJB45_17295 [Halomonas huangheensis]
MECPEGELFLARLTQPDPNIRAFNTLNTAALYCDTNYPIFTNDAGVMCVMTHQRINMLTGSTSTASGMEAQQENSSQNTTQDSQ